MTDLDELKAFVKATPDPSCAHMDWPGAVLDLIEQLEKAEADNDRLREALKPFAKIKYKDRKLGAVAPRGDRETETVEIQLRFLRRARAEHAKGGKDND